jgi:hypothetical protein
MQFKSLHEGLHLPGVRSNGHGLPVKNNFKTDDIFNVYPLPWLFLAFSHKMY